MKDRLLQKGFTIQKLETAYEHAFQQDRTKLLTPKRTPEMEYNGRVRVIATYDQRSNKAIGVLRRNWDILRADPDLTDILSCHPQVTFRG